MVNCDILEVTADRELEQNIWSFVRNRYLKVLVFLLSLIYFHVQSFYTQKSFHTKFISLTTEYTLQAYTEYSVYHWMCIVEIAFLHIYYFIFKLKTGHFCEISAVIQAYCHTVCNVTTCKLFITVRHIEVYAFSTPVCKKISHPELWLLYTFLRKGAKVSIFLIKFSTDSN